MSGSTARAALRGELVFVGLSSNQQRALKIVGDPTEQELKAIRAVLDAIRAGGATFPAFERLDGQLSAEELRVIRGHAVALLRRAGVLGEIPTPLDRVMEVSKLVLAGEIELEPEMKRKLRDRFGDLVDRALNMILGSIRFDTRGVYLQPDMYWLRKRFVQACERACSPARQLAQGAANRVFRAASVSRTVSRSPFCCQSRRSCG